VPLQEFGLDSMDAIELVYALEDWLRLPLDATLLWRAATLDALAIEIERTLQARPEAAPASTHPTTPASLDALLQGIEALSDDEVSAEFERRMRSRTT
jgi:hypothetical protein